MGFLTAYCTDKGIRKTTNQDALLIKIADTSVGEIAFICVCDGMGGLQKGELASSMVIKRLSKWFEKELPDLLSMENRGKEICQSLKKVILQENAQISRFGESRGIKLGTTLTGMLVIGEEYFVVHIGDTRLYEIGTTIRQITEDQTLVNKEVEMKRLSKIDAEKDPRRSILLQCVGASPKLEPDFLTGIFHQQAIYMICCDGFRHEITSEEILQGFRPQLLQNEESMYEQCRHYIEINKSRMEKDNITVVLLGRDMEDRYA
ncbi:MAG: serine/threonine-protein phosphatase [Lachnospiraceae bacterium]|nr:serine/threonine-protein phosphatase [Lachnospiraceae bacterium]